MLPFCTLSHLCLGGIFAWSVFNDPLTKCLGVVAPAAQDWIVSDISPVFSFVMSGFALGALIGKYLNKWGPRATVLIGASCLGSGFGLASLGATLHSLTILKCGGAVWGFANGWSYVPPLATLVKWFPDRKGFAAGSTVVGFGAGAAIAAPVYTRLLNHFKLEPTRIGSAD